MSNQLCSKIMFLSQYFRTWKMFSTEKNTTNEGSFVGLLTFQQTFNEHKWNTDIDINHCHKEKQISQRNRMETHMYCHLIYETSNTAAQQEKNSLCNKCECHLDTYKGRKQILTSYLTTYTTIGPRWHVNLNRKSETIELLEENIERRQELKIVKDLKQDRKSIFSWDENVKMNSIKI